MKFEVCVELKPEVLDVQGRAIRDTLLRLGHDDIADVKVSKRFVIETKDHSRDARAAVAQVAAEFLANSVAETFFIKEL